MTDSLRDQLLGLGFKSAPKPDRKSDEKPAPRPRQQPSRPAHAPRPPVHANARKTGVAQPRPSQGRARTREDIDLAKAYAIRAQREKDERIEAERLKQEEARKRREAKAQLAELLKDRALNDPAADIARHFDYGGKIKRIHVTPAQLKALKDGGLRLFVVGYESGNQAILNNVKKGVRLDAARREAFVNSRSGSRPRPRRWRSSTNQTRS